MPILKTPPLFTKRSNGWLLEYVSNIPPFSQRPPTGQLEELREDIGFKPHLLKVGNLFYVYKKVTKTA